MAPPALISFSRPSPPVGFETLPPIFEQRRIRFATAEEEAALAKDAAQRSRREVRRLNRQLDSERREHIAEALQLKDKTERELARERQEREQAENRASRLQLEKDDAERQLEKERRAHKNTQRELEELRQKKEAWGTRERQLLRQKTDLENRLQQAEAQPRHLTPPYTPGLDILGPGVEGSGCTCSLELEEEAQAKEENGESETYAAPSSTTEEGEIAAEDQLNDLQTKVDLYKSEIDKLKGEIAQCREAVQVGARAAATLDVTWPKLDRLSQENSRLREENRHIREAWMEIRGTFRTVIRIRGPPPPPEVKKPHFEIADTNQGQQRVTVRVPRTSASGKTAPTAAQEFVFDRVFSPCDDEATIYQEFAPLLESVRDGAQAVVIAYGRSGTGKTRTIHGLLGQVGRTIFPEDAGEEDSTEISAEYESAPPSCSAHTTLTYTELYSHTLTDLLTPTATAVPLPALSHNLIDPVLLASCQPLRSQPELTAYLDTGSNRRHTRATNVNASSSRSHAFVSLSLPSGGCITFVDLAGNERVDESGADGEEVKDINVGLTELRTALRSVVEGQRRGSGGGLLKNGEKVWARGKHLLPKIIGGLVCRRNCGTEKEAGGLSAKVVLMGTVDLVATDRLQMSVETMKTVAEAAGVKAGGGGKP